MKNVKVLVIGNLLRYVPAKHYQNRLWFDKVIAKNKMVQFFDSHRRYGLLPARASQPITCVCYVNFQLHYSRGSLKLTNLLNISRFIVILCKRQPATPGYMSIKYLYSLTVRMVFLSMTKMPTTVNPIGSPDSRLRNTFNCKTHAYEYRVCQKFTLLLFS